MAAQFDIEKRLTQLQDSLDSLHQRMDRFYSWAGQLQSEFRSMKQRTGFLETQLQDLFEFTPPPEEMVAPQKGHEKVFGGEEDKALWARLMRLSERDHA